MAAVVFKPFYVGHIRYARNLEAMAEFWIQYGKYLRLDGGILVVIFGFQLVEILDV